MALDLTTRYPSQVDDSDVAYPYGKAVNITVAGDGTGTPWEADLVNDIIGFLQSLLNQGGVTPNESPDSLTNAQYFTALANIFIDGTDGGTYTPASAIVVNGFGIETVYLEAAELVATLGTIDTLAASEVEIGGGLEVQGACDFQHVAAFSLTVTDFILGLAGLSIVGNASVGADLTVVDDAIIGDDLDVGGTATIDTLLVETNLTVQGPATFADPVTLTNDAHIRHRVVIGPDAPSEYGVDDADIIHIASSTAPRAYTLNTDGASNGSIITFFTSASNDITINGAYVINASGDWRGVRLVHISGSWALLEFLASGP
jgi:hypothetical protein